MHDQITPASPASSICSVMTATWSMPCGPTDFKRYLRWQWLAGTRALAAAGFDVTALDLSPFATEAAKAAVPPDDYLVNLLEGRSLSPNGRLDFVVGDLSDASVCPGPFDVVIERRTLQLYPQHSRPSALLAVADRLAPRGIFSSHAHDGGWRPPAPRTHACEIGL
jgi:hypothetical protein